MDESVIDEMANHIAKAALYGRNLAKLYEVREDLKEMQSLTKNAKVRALYQVIIESINTAIILMERLGNTLVREIDWPVEEEKAQK